MSSDNIVEVDERTGDAFWEEFVEPKIDQQSTVWYCETAFPISDDKLGREIFCSTSKSQLIQRLYYMLLSEEVQKTTDFTPNNSESPVENIRRFYENVPERNLVVRLLPLL